MLARRISADTKSKMNLLSPDQIKDEKKEAVEQGRKSSSDMAEESARITRELNTVRAQADEKKALIAQETDDFEAQHATRRAVLKQEVDSLEARRRDAMKPIDDIRREAEERMEVVKSAETELATDRADIAKMKDLLSNRDAVMIERLAHYQGLCREEQR